MASFKKLSKSDVTFVPYYANKQWTISIDCFPTSNEYLTIYKGTNFTGSFSSGSDPKSEGQYERLLYSQINQLFYQKYTTLLNTSSLVNSIYYESASQQRPTQSYFIYNDSARLVENFPTGAMEGIRVLAINQGVFGDKILPNTFILSSSAYRVVDDGYGNLYDSQSSNTHIGNIFYAHGLGIITNQDYQLMFPTSSDDCLPTTTTTSTTTTSTTAPPTTTTTTTTTAAPTTTTSTTTSTTTAPTTTSTTTSTTTAPTTTSTTTTTTTAAPTTTTSTTTTTTTAEPTTTTTTTTTSTTTSTTTEAPETITITACAGVQANGSGNVVAYAYASAPVDTNVTVDLTWTAADTSTISGTATILAGETCGTITLTGADPNETGSNLEITSITPGTFGNQTYVEGTETLSSSCITCPIP